MYRYRKVKEIDRKKKNQNDINDKKKQKQNKNKKTYRSTSFSTPSSIFPSGIGFVGQV